MKCNQKGFTLVEIAIVLVIIGLLVGGVLKGQSMIHNAKVKRVVGTADEMRAAIYTYYDRFGHLPGDANRNGQITAAESPGVFQDLMQANIISGDFDGTNYPNHPFGGSYRVLWYSPAGGMAGNYIRFDLLPGDVGLEIDTKHDDGTHNSGSIRASGAYTGATLSLYMPM